jgi:hypothetical protein
MDEVLRYTCACCGDEHVGAPSFACAAPDHYNGLSPAEQKELASLSDDFCVIEDVGRFIRACLEVPIHGSDDPFLWGVWVSLSEESFETYRDHFEDDGYRDRFFCWFCNRLPAYPDTLGLAGTVELRGDGQRPVVHLHAGDHPLIRDHEEGISWDQTVAIAQSILHSTH